MPLLENISYSEDATVAAFCNYFDFLTKLYLPKHFIREPPTGGWPGLSRQLRGLHKSKKVYSLLSRLPYIHDPAEDYSLVMAGPNMYFADWQFLAQAEEANNGRGENMRDVRDDTEEFANAPSHMIGLTSGPANKEVFVLDTKLGIVHWRNCDDTFYSQATRERILDDPFDYAPNDREAEWISESISWAIEDFFEVLKDQFRKLSFIPLSPRTVHDDLGIWGRDWKEVYPFVQAIFRQHGWPNEARYRKEECFEALKAGLLKEYPDYHESSPDD